MLVLVTGAKGQLGRDIIGEFTKQGIDYIAIDREELDIVDEKACESYFKDLSALKSAQARSAMPCTPA